MSAKLTATLKNYHNGGGDLTLNVTSALISANTVALVRVIKLIVTRKPDQYSSRLGMFAFVRRRPGYQSLGFPEATLTFETYSADGKFISRTVVVFFDVGFE